MSVLRSLESKLAGLVEGTFSRAFKSEVRPVEIARKLAKEMDQHKVQSLSRVYGRPISLQVELDESLLGGLVVKVGDELIDGSVASRIAAARRTLPS